MITINTRKLYQILDATPASQNIMLVGRHGIGKSEILTAYYRQQGIRVVPLFLGQMADPGDLIGLPMMTTSGSSMVNHTVFASPSWFPDDNEPIVIFLDELNRARPEILQAVMDLALNRRLARHQLPAGSRIISAINEGDEYQLTHLDPALVSRFNVYQFCPTVSEWLLWAEQAHHDRRVIDFIQNEPSLLDGTPEVKAGDDTGLEKYPDRRAWVRVSELLQSSSHLRNQIDEDSIDIIAGIVGAQAASRFYAFTQGRQMLSGVQVLNDFGTYESVIRRYRLHQLAILNESIFRQFEVEGLASIPDETDELRHEQISRYASNLCAYYSLLEDMEQREGIAHLANLFQSGSYEQTVLFITTYCPSLLEKMMTFISEL